MDSKKALSDVWASISEIRASLQYLERYRGNKFYKSRYATDLKKLNREYEFLKNRITTSENPDLIRKLGKITEAVNFLISDHPFNEKINCIDQIELFWPQVEVEFEKLDFSTKHFDIPEEIPNTEYRLDIEEAIKCYSTDCFISALVLCRRSYEGALVEHYKVIEKRDPVEELKCKHCNATIRGNAYLGIAKLHEWAIKQGLVTNRLKQIGFLLTDIGAGAAHPPLEQFPRDKEIAKLGITATLTLLKEICTYKKGQL